MIFLDTNVVSELMSPLADRRVVQWMDRQPAASVWTTSITVFEIRYGLETMARGKRREDRSASFDRWLYGVIDGRVANLDPDSAARAASLAGERRASGRGGDLRDTFIAGIVLANRATLATRNVKHFEDIATSIVNPWED
jgi:hypothetical protein